MDPAQLAREMEKINRALDHARQLAVALDQLEDVRNLAPQPRHSPLRTLLEHAQEAAGRVTNTLRGQRPST